MTALPPARLLVVDDREENLVAMEALLRRADAEVLRAGSGREALELLLANDVALAIVDVQMPEMDGFELAELMRGSERTRDVPIVFVTAGPRDRHRVFQGYEAGAVDFLHKPIDPLVLRGKVDVFLQLHRQKRELAARLRELERARDELREADARKDEFLAVLSHELRNPLMPIRNGLYVLQRAAGSDARAARTLQMMDRQLSHLARLVDDLLDVTRITRGKVQLHRERLDLAECVRRAAEDQRPLFAAAGVALEVEVAPEPLWAEADPVRIAQIAGNLLSNAAKFTPPGGRARLSLERRGDRAVLRVRDDGAGIAPRLLARVFEPFAQADRTLDRSRGGLGLGLALVKGLAERHGGSVAAASDGPGRGAEFTVWLPLEQAPAPQRADDPAPARAARRRVLVVEDLADSAASLAEALELMGHEVAVAHDGPEGLAVARAFRPDVVLCDIGLPGMDGFEVARRMRAEPPLRDAVLVALSGYALPEDRRRAREAGFSHHVAKPPALDALERLLAELPPPGGPRPDQPEPAAPP